MDGREETAAALPARSGFRLARGRRRTLATLAIVAAALLGGIFLIFQTIEAERIQRAQAANTSKVLVELRHVTTSALNAETGQRGYLITLDRRYLQSYYFGRDQYRLAIRNLKERLGNEVTPRQRELVDRIETLADAKFAEIGQAVTLIEAGDLTGARRLILTDEGQEVMERLRGAVRELEDIERDVLLDATRQTTRTEARVVPLLVGLLALVIVALWLGFRLSERAALAEAEAAQAAALAEARDRADLLARELNHRVKNLFAVILAIVRMTGKDSPEAKPVVDKIAERIHALLIAHEVTQGTIDKPVASLRTLLETTVRPYLTSERSAEFDGPEVALGAKQVTPLGLVLHELTTNAVKYGCWKDSGILQVGWTVEGETLEIVWREDCAGDGSEPSRKGFGSLLMTSAAKQLRGSIDRAFTPEGVCVTIQVPADS